MEGGSLQLWERMANFVRSRGGTVGAAPLDALAPGDIDAEFELVMDDLHKTA